MTTELKRMTKETLAATVAGKVEAIKFLEQQVTDQLAERDRMRGQVAEMGGRHAAATAEREAAISRLKGELLAAQMTIARQGGYIDRALEDDAVRELGAGIAPPAVPPPPAEPRRCRPPTMEWEAPGGDRYSKPDPKSVLGKPWTDL